jgi:preprotein translocase subunit SecD
VLTVRVCGAALPMGSSCPALSDPGSALSSLITAEMARAAAAGDGAMSATPAGAGEITIRSGLDSSEAAALYGAADQLAFATPLAGTPDPSSAAFQADQQGRWDPSQFDDPSFYPVDPSSGKQYHWNIDTAIPASAITRASIGLADDGVTPAVDVTFDPGAGAEWTRITDAAYSAYQSTSADLFATSPLAQIGVFLDNDVVSTPVVLGGDQGSSTQISGLTPQQANVVVASVGHPLPVAVGVASEAPVAP